jgi:hypothetical protein
MTAKKLTAEELAVKMEMGNHDWADDAADMLRQQQAEIETLKKELALQRLSDIGQEIENEQVGWLGYHEGHLVSFLQTQEQIESFLENTNTAGRVLPVYTHQMRDELQTLVKSFFEDYLDVQEESDSGRVFNPIHISCVRAMKVEPLAKLLMRMRELSGAKE